MQCCLERIQILIKTKQLNMLTLSTILSKELLETVTSYLVFKVSLKTKIEC